MALILTSRVLGIQDMGVQIADLLRMGDTGLRVESSRLKNQEVRAIVLLTGSPFVGNHISVPARTCAIAASAKLLLLLSFLFWDYHYPDLACTA